MKHDLIIFSSLSLISGFFGGYFLSKKKYESLADREVASVKKSLEAHYNSVNDNEPKYDIDNTKKEDIKKEPKKDEKKVKRSKIKNIAPVEETPINDKYKDYSSQYRSKNIEKEAGDDIEPYVITPEEFNQSDYDSKTLFYYKDKVLTDDDYNIISNYESLIGIGTLSQIGIYETDSVYVRNDKLKIDYEILSDEREYYKISQKINNHPLDD